MAIFLTPESRGQRETTPPGHADFQFREAATTIARDDSFEARMEKVRQACARKFSDGGYGDYGYGGPSQYASPVNTGPDWVIFMKGGKKFVVDYKLNGGEVSFGKPEEVADTYTKVKGGATIADADEEDD